jgi:hypothetical protein
MMLKISMKVKWLTSKRSSKIEKLLQRTNKLLQERLLRNPSAKEDGMNSMVPFTKMTVQECYQMDLPSKA